MWKGFSRDSLRNLGQKLRVPSKKVKTSSDAGTDLKIPTPGATGGDKPEPSASSTLSSHMMDKWKAQNILTWTNVSAQAKTYIPIITRAGYKAIISDSAQKATQQSSQKATEMAKQSTQHLSSYAQRASSHAKSVASEVAKHGKETMIEEAHTMKRDILRWLWW